MKKNIINFSLFILSLTIIFAIWFSWRSYILPLGGEGGMNLEKLAWAGDSFGALNALFTGFAFAGVAFTIYLQLLSEKNRKDEKNEEIFERKFFQLKRLLEIAREKLVFAETKHTQWKGEEAFISLLENVKRHAEILNKSIPSVDFKIEEFIVAFCEKSEKCNSSLNQYYRILYRTISETNKASISKESKVWYVSIIRDDLSTFELWLLGLYGLSATSEPFASLLGKYCFFCNLNNETYEISDEELKTKKDNIGFYPSLIRVMKKRYGVYSFNISYEKRLKLVKG